MAMLGNLVFLCAASLVAAQTYYMQPKLNSSRDDFKYEQISKILQAPMFRSDPAVATAPDISSYLPQTYDRSEPKELSEETKTTSGSYLLPVPSLVLQAPRAEATNLYANQKSYLQPVPVYSPYQVQPQGQPLVQLPTANFQTPYIPITMKAFVPQYVNQDSKQFMPLNPISKQLDLPLPDGQPKSQNFGYPPVPSAELQTPQVEPNNQQYEPSPHALAPQYSRPQIQNIYNILPQNVETPYSTLPLSLEAPKSESIKPVINLPTKYYPKKYNPNSDDYKLKKATKKIPVIELVGDELVDVTKIKKSGKPQKLIYDPSKSDRIEEVSLDSYLKNQAREKQRQKFEESQLKHQSRKENESRQQQQFIDKKIARASVANSDPEASETGFNHLHHGGNSFAAPVQHSGVGLGGVSDDGNVAHHNHGEGGERTEFQMHGQHGPHSYKFGFDTGKGKNRQFRYEERDNEGIVKGHYGFYDKHGKLQVVNYDAHPHHGFHAEGSFGRV